jgi:hypothetical protein
VEVDLVADHPDRHAIGQQTTLPSGSATDPGTDTDTDTGQGSAPKTTPTTPTDDTVDGQYTVFL